MANQKVTAVFTFFSKSTCGYCHQFKGDKTKEDGTVVTDPNSGWERLTSDKDLQDAGVEFVLFKFGPEKDPKTGKTVNYTLPDSYAQKIRGVPYLELKAPGDKDGETGIHYDQAREFPIIKKWILNHIKSGTFKNAAKAPRPSPAAMPPPMMRPRVEPSVTQAPKVQIQQSARAEPSSEDAPQNFRPAPTVFGMGTRPVPEVIQPQQERTRPAPKVVEKTPPKFMPANWDQ